MKLNNNNIEMRCTNCDKENKVFEEQDILKTISTKFTCVNCGTPIILYKQNLKCSSCKNIVCWNCRKIHLTNCLSLCYVKLYEVGYKCEIHQKYFIEYCFICKKIYVQCAKMFIHIKQILLKI